MRSLAALALRAGGSDCEQLASSGLAQPVNSWSSLAYVAAGATVAWWTRGVDRVVRGTALLFAVAVALNGLGGLAYHGGSTAAGQWLHDLAIAAVFAVVVSHDAWVLRGRATTPIAPVLALWGAAGALLVLAPGATNGLSAVLALAAVGLEVVVIRRGLRPVGAGSPARLAYALLAGAVALGVVLKWASGTEGPLCAPASLLQGHAVWHGLTAVAMAAWARAALSRSHQPARALPA